MTTSAAERPDTEIPLILGVDTHLDFHVAVSVDHLGTRLGQALRAYDDRQGLRRAPALGGRLRPPQRCAGVEGTSSYGAGLARHLRTKGVEVLEVERPEPRRRRSRQSVEKSDPSDAAAAARAVLAAEASGVPKSADGHVEMIRALRAARRSAIKALGLKGRQPAAGLARNGARATASPLGRALLHQGARLGGRALSPRRCPY
jgi:transposase